MKILIVNTYYYPTFAGGAEVSVKLLAEGMVKTGNRVIVLTTGLQNKVYRLNGVVVICIKQLNFFNSLHAKTKPLLLRVLWHALDSCNIFYHYKVSGILKKLQPDLVHTNNIQGFSPFVWFTIKALKIPLIHSLRDYYMLCHKCNMFNNSKNCDSLCTPCKATNTVKKRFFGLPDHIIGISNFMLKKTLSFLPGPDRGASMIYNATVDPPSLPKTDGSGKLVLGYIGRVAEDKGVAYLVNEISVLSSAQKELFKVIFAGPGDATFINELKAKLAGIDYEFLGICTPQEFYSRIDVLVVPALWNEPFGRIVIESRSYGVPVCQSNRGGLAELYDPASSWIYTPEPGNLREQIGNILNNPHEVISKKAACKIGLDKFSVENYVTAHLNVYHMYVARPVKQKRPAGIPAGLQITEVN